MSKKPHREKWRQVTDEDARRKADFMDAFLRAETARKRLDRIALFWIVLGVISVGVAIAIFILS